ncbi:hypothetical protein Fcan01_09879 [Folsomia candida]|uniref:Solute carrier family 13 member 5 n=1 Tax=Folsomia candida TaxID=158441 RepID=A0A226EFQ5_FOLCA|nr:hypothetical protein Fcan01_09879 [Folsomia candida]
MAAIGSRLLQNWKLIFTIVLPLVLLPLLFIEYEDAAICKTASNHGPSNVAFKAAYVILIVAIFWMVEALPLAVTSLLPLVLFPFLGVRDSSSVSASYMKETNAMFLGGLIIALAVEYCNLHRRIALRVMTIIGSSPIRLMAGIMLTTMFLSMWMSNTATAAMMVPIVLAIVDELHNTPVATDRPEGGNSSKRPSKQMSLEMGAEFASTNQLTSQQSLEDLELEAKLIKNKKMYMFAVAYSANIGGTGVITGTGPNLVFQDVIKNVDVGQNGKYLDMASCIINTWRMLLNIFVAFVYLTFQFHGVPNWRYWPLISLCSKKRTLNSEEQIERVREEKVAKLLMSEYRKLGPMTFHEMGVGFVFFTTVMLWLFRDPRFMPGWDEQIEGAEIGDATAAMLGVMLLFIIPKDLSFILGTAKPGKTPEALLDWKFIQKNLPWGVVLLLGGGFALSDSSDASRLSCWIGQQLANLDSLPNPVILIIVMVLTALVTEVCSNVATANVILPILLTLSRSLGIHPLYLTVPATVTCSYAFMLPVATPPNAIVFAAGDLRIRDMVKAGAFLNLSCTIVFFLVNISYGELLFNYSGYIYENATAF